VRQSAWQADPRAAPPRAVFFDLDDTLFDYHHAARAGLRAAARLDPALARAKFPDP
jgi:FMN phosphatase YigB (HAD superfamily)